MVEAFRICWGVFLSGLQRSVKAALSVSSGLSRGLWGERTTWTRWRASMSHTKSTGLPNTPAWTLTRAPTLGALEFWRHQLIIHLQLPSLLSLLFHLKFSFFLHLKTNICAVHNFSSRPPLLKNIFLGTHFYIPAMLASELIWLLTWQPLINDH